MVFRNRTNQPTDTCSAVSLFFFRRTTTFSFRTSDSRPSPASTAAAAIARNDPWRKCRCRSNGGTVRSSVGRPRRPTRRQSRRCTCRRFRRRRRSCCCCWCCGEGCPDRHDDPQQTNVDGMPVGGVWVGVSLRVIVGSFGRENVGRWVPLSPSLTRKGAFQT